MKMDRKTSQGYVSNPHCFKGGVCFAKRGNSELYRGELLHLDAASAVASEKDDLE